MHLANGDARAIIGVHVHDDAAGLRRSLPTAVHQRFPGKAQVVVVDDAAGDQARRALEDLARWHPGLKVVQNDVRRGRAAARNQVLEMAGESAVAWLDPGDVWHPRKLAIQHATLVASGSPDQTLVTSSHRQVDLRTSSEQLVEPDLRGDLLGRLLDRDLPVPVGTLLGTADAFRLLGGFDPSLPFRDDEELLLRFLANGGRVVAADGGALSTGSEVRDHPTAREVAAADRRIRRSHGATLRRRDANGARRSHRREMQRASRLHRKEGRPVRAMAYRLRADATAVVDRLSPSLRETPTSAPSGPRAPRAERHTASTAAAPTPDGPPPDVFASLHQAAERADWADAMAIWDGLPPRVRDDADPSTVEVVARSLRALGRYLEAIDTAELGLRRWPQHPRLEIERAKSRAATTDWTTALQPAEAREPGSSHGEVSTLGLLAGDDGLVTGHVLPGATPLPVEVSLRVDDLVVVTTFARTAADADAAAPREFSLSCEQLLEFLGDGDLITVVAHGQPLPIEGFGDAAQVRTGYPSRLPALRDRLDNGAVFTKFGQLRPGYTTARKRRTFELVDEVAAVVRDAYGYVCTPFYGNLLGAVREQDFIAHDVGGFDVGYLSQESRPEAVRSEVVDICRRLLDREFHLELEATGAMIRRAPGDRIFVDLNYAWTTSDGDLGMSYGWRYDPASDRAHLQAPRDTYLAGRLVAIPGAAEEVLHQTYGPGWATPDQGFDLGRGLERDPAYLLTDQDLDAIRAMAPDRVTILAER